MVQFSGNFTNEDLKGDTGRKDPIDEVIDILTAPSRPAPVNVGMMPERRGNVNIPMGQSTFVNVPGRPGEEQAQTPLNVASPFTTALNLDPDMFDQDTGDIINYPVGGGRGGPFDGGNFLTSIPANFGIANVLTDPTGGSGPPSARGLAGINTQGGYLGDQLFNIPTDLGASIDPYEQFGDNLLGGDASTVYGINPIVKRIAEFQGYDMDTDEGVRKYLADTQQTMEDSGDALEARRKDQDREMAAMLAAQQQQPVDPCPEGYRMDPVSKVCVPTDDTTEPTDPVKRTYDTMTKPEPNYTAATNFNVPAINLPDIFG